MVHPALPPKIHYPEDASAETSLVTVHVHKRKDALIFHMEFHHAPDNRLTPTFVDKCVLVALDDIERIWRADRAKELTEGPSTGNAVLITSGAVSARKGIQPHRFYSNGLNLDDGPSNIRGWMTASFMHMCERFLTFPIPTIAAINGHAFAGGLAVALSHDYRVLKSAPGKGGQAMLSYNEVFFGAPLPPGMMALARDKLRSAVCHKLVVQGHRFMDNEAVEAELATDLASSGEEVLSKAFKMADALAPLPSLGAVQYIKEEMYKRTVADLRLSSPFFKADGKSYVDDQRLGPHPERFSKL